MYHCRFLQTGRWQNHIARGFATVLLATAQSAWFAVACSQVPEDGPDDVTPPPLQSTDGDSADRTSDPADEPTDLPAARSAVGYWISTREAPDGTLAGLAVGGELGGSISIDISEDNGQRWTFNGGQSEDGMTGSCRRSLLGDDFDLDDFLSLGEPPACTGTFSEDGRRLTIHTTATVGATRQEWQLVRSAQPHAGLTAAWDTPWAVNDRLISGFDGRVLNMLLIRDGARAALRAAWDADNGGFFTIDPDGHRWYGLLRDGGNELFVWIDDFNTVVEHYTLQHRAEPAMFAKPLSGRWMSSYATAAGSSTVHGAATLVFDGSTLYVSQRDDSHVVEFQSDYDQGSYWSVFAEWQEDHFESTSDSPGQWWARLDPQANALLGFWGGDEEQGWGFERGAAAADLDVSGTWQSLSVNYEVPSDPVQTVGSATVAFDGTLLTVTEDVDGVMHHLEATWIDDHFSGQWWPASDPADKLRWDGEVVLDGLMIHGKWEYGEWSFIKGEMAESDEDLVNAVSAGEVRFVANSDNPIMAVARDPDSGAIIQARRSAGRLSSLRLLGDGVVLHFDERNLPVAAELDTGATAQFDWSDDLTQMTVSAEAPDGAHDTVTLAIDLSDAGLEQGLQRYESQTGQSAQRYRDYLATYGNPWLGEDSRSITQNEAQDGRGGARSIRVLEFISFMTGGLAVVQLGTGLLFVGLPGSALTALGTALLPLAGLGVLLIGAVIIVMTIFLYVTCEPCTLKCFWNCSLDSSPRGACCFTSTCRQATSSRCMTMGGFYVGDNTVCTQCR